HAAALRRHIAHLAGRLQTMTIGLAPPFALIVEDAARVECEVTAEGAHVALRRPGDMAGRLRDRRIVPHDTRIGRKFGKRHGRADLQLTLIGPDIAQLRYGIDFDQHRRRDNAAPDIHHQVGAAAEYSALWMRSARSHQLSQRARPDQIEGRQRVHQDCPPLVLRPRARFSSAAKTRSGVTGRSLKRSPVASAIAFVSAGRNAASEPSPASLAPNGPCGSLLSTMPTSIGGESWMVGTR